MLETDAVMFAFETDPASMTIRALLLSEYGFESLGSEFGGRPIYCQNKTLLVTLPGESIHAPRLEADFKARIFIFLSRHESAKGIPALLVHVPGNWSDDVSYGGRSKEVCVAPASALKSALLSMNRSLDVKRLDYRCSVEVTHHGPYVERTPCLFVELGSDVSRWKDKEAGRVCARAALAAATAKPVDEVFVGIGGGHYAPAFTRAMLQENYALSHMIPGNLVSIVGRDGIAMAMERSFEKPRGALLDLKGLNEKEKTTLGKNLDELEIPFIKL